MSLSCNRLACIASLILIFGFSGESQAEIHGLGSFPGVFFSRATAVSADGSVVVGDSGNQAFRWTSSSGMQGLGYLPSGGFLSAALGVSADGSVVVGVSDANMQARSKHFAGPVVAACKVWEFCLEAIFQVLQMVFPQMVQ